MADLSEDELFAMERAHRADETERCALLNEQLATIHEASAARLRAEGSYTTRFLWFKPVRYVRLQWERDARVLDRAAHGLRLVAHCIRMGYDPRKLQPHERDAEQMVVLRTGVDGDPSLHTVDAWMPCPKCVVPMDCGSWQSCERGDVGRGGRH